MKDQHARTAEQFARRAHEQSVLYRFTDRLYRARSMGDVYDASLDAIADGLGCARASILRFDDNGIMRFVAWRNLSAAYRQAVDGHSPWRPGDQNAEPIFIDDVQTADIPEALKATILQEGIRALAFIPLTIDDKVIGKFMTYFAKPRDFTTNELQLSVTIARQLGFSIGRRLADDNARRLSAAVESSKDAIFTSDLNGIVTSWNTGAERLLGYSQGEAVGKPAAVLVPRDRRGEQAAILSRIRNREHDSCYETVWQRNDGNLVDISLTVSPVLDRDETITGVSYIARDITDRRRAEEKQHLLLREMEHRVKNLFAVASSIVRVRARSTTSPSDLASAVCAQLSALAQAHSLTLTPRLTDDPREAPATSLHSLIRTILSPYDCKVDAESGFMITGPDVRVSGNAITPLALLLYEFATNAAKHGSLSMPSGRIAVECTAEGDRYTLVWCERGGPSDAMQGGEGFGSMLVKATAAQLDAKLSQDFSPTGLTIRLSLSADRLAN
ncbi:sensor histidine kinase [Pararhizobium sp. LjRoot238]|uniref:sensor histidine kinase n=1 Tax=Pararhizobium sp. LjRoot238 TaxID=3342293 RepID=UPI003ECE666C